MYAYRVTRCTTGLKILYKKLLNFETQARQVTYVCIYVIMYIA